MRVMAPDVVGAPAPDPAVQPAPPQVPQRQRNELKRRPSNRISTPFLLRLALALAVVPIVLIAAAIQVSASRNDRAVDTVGRDATSGITLAQEIKFSLADLDEIAVRSLVEQSSIDDSGFPTTYNTQRRQLHETMVRAAAESPTGEAHQQPLKSIDYALAHYHALLKDSFAANAGGDPAQALAVYDQAHSVMADTLLPEADFLDKANTYVLNNAYENHKGEAREARVPIVLACVLLLTFLVALQALLFRRFRRMVSLGLLVAGLLAIGNVAFALNRLDSSSAHLRAAREESFDAVHILARAEATVVMAHQAQGRQVLDPASGDAAEDAHDEALDKLESDGTGYLPDVVDASGSAEVRNQARFTMENLEEHRASQPEPSRETYEDDGWHQELLAGVHVMQEDAQAVFQDRAEQSADATRSLLPINLTAACIIALLVVVGIYPRLREYGGQ